jgi:hypothetical protein
MSFNIADGRISFSFDLGEFIENLTKEEKMELVKAITWEEVMDEAVRRLTGESETWGSDDDRLTLEVLAKMERNVLSGYKWSTLRELNDLAKNWTSHEHLFWKMYHDPIHGKFFQQWLRDNNIESNYTHDLQAWQDFRAMVEQRLDDFAGNIESTESA